MKENLRKTSILKVPIVYILQKTFRLEGGTAQILQKTSIRSFEPSPSPKSSYLPTEQKPDGFENGEHKIIFVTSAILLFLVTIGFCLFRWGFCHFGGCR